MAQVKLYTWEGKETGTIDLPDMLFAVPTKSFVIHEAIVAQEANSRAVSAHTKDRGQVRGGGRKPWAQKHTGRARHSSTRSPIWVGGGVAHGPLAERNFGIKINKKTKRLALAMVLSDRVRNAAFTAVESFDIPEAKTKFAAAMRKALPGADASTLVILTKEEAKMKRALQNMPKTATIYAHSLNVRDAAKYQNVIASKTAIEALSTTFAA